MAERRRSLSLGSKSKSKLCQHSRMGQSLTLCQPSPGWSLAALCPHALARCRGATVCIHIFVTPSFKHRCFTLPLGTAHVLLLPPAFCHHMAVLFQYKLSLCGCMCVVPGHAARNGDAGLIHIQLLLASHVHAGDLSSTVLVQDRYAHGRWLIYSPCHPGVTNCRGKAKALCVLVLTHRCRMCAGSVLAGETSCAAQESSKRLWCRISKPMWGSMSQHRHKPPPADTQANPEPGPGQAAL